MMSLIDDMRFLYTCAYFLVAAIGSSLAVFGFFKVTDDLGGEAEIKAFRYIIAGYFFFCATNGIWIWCVFIRFPIKVGMVLNTVNMVALAFCAYYWFIYTEARLGNIDVYSKPFRLMTKALLIFAVVNVLATSFIRRTFGYNENGMFVRGPSYILHSAIPIFYFVASFIRCATSLKDADSHAKKREGRMVLLFAICPIIAAIVDLTIPNLPVYELLMLSGILYIAINKQAQQMNTDALTRLNNRRSADEWLFTKIKKVSAEHPLYVFLADVNDFKKINDTHGHIEGDNALRIVADTFRKTGSLQRSFVARWGGDEFIMIVESEHLDSPAQLVRFLRSLLKRTVDEARLPYALAISVGVAACTRPESNVASLTKMADAMLYHDKKLSRLIA